MTKYLFKYMQNSFLTNDTSFMKNWDIISPYVTLIINADLKVRVRDPHRRLYRCPDWTVLYCVLQQIDEHPFQQLPIALDPPQARFFRVCQRHVDKLTNRKLDIDLRYVK